MAARARYTGPRRDSAHGETVAPAFGGINLEDISAPRCFDIERRLIEELDIPVMHDDQHGTAIVVLAGLLNAAKVVKKNIKKLKVVISGAGAAGTAVAKLLMAAGVTDIILLDRKGTLHIGRTDLPVHKKNSPRSRIRGKSKGASPKRCGARMCSSAFPAKGLLKAEHVASMASRGNHFRDGESRPGDFTG